jgi:hypothetical protein
MTTNWLMGFKRLWIVVSLLWVVAMFLQYQVFHHALNVIGWREFVPKTGGISLFDDIPVSADYSTGQLVRYLVVATAIPAVVPFGFWTFRWIVRGFGREQTRNGEDK